MVGTTFFLTCMDMIPFYTIKVHWIDIVNRWNANSISVL